jgi:hypothetical protein
VTFSAGPYFRKSICRTISGDPAGYASTNPAPDPATRTRVDMDTTPDCPLQEDADNVSVTNSKVESAMHHQRWKEAMHDPSFTEEAFNALSSADAYIRAARDGLAGATHQLSKDMRVKTLSRFNDHAPVAPET